MNKSEVIDGLAERLGDKVVAAAALDGLIDIVSRSLAKGERVAISGFGTWEKVERPARVGRNPATGQSIRIKKSAAPKFKAGNTLKAVVSGTTKLGREPKHTALLPANITSASVRRKVDAALGTEAAPVAAKAPVAKAPAAKAPAAAKATAREAPAKVAAVKAPAKAAVKAPAKVAAAKTAPARRAVAKAAPAAKTAGRKVAAATAAPVKSVAAPAKRTARTVAKTAPARRAVAATPATKPAAARRGATKSVKVDAAAVRSWAIANGVPVSSRGRIGADVVSQYQAASK